MLLLYKQAATQRTILRLEKEVVCRKVDGRQSRNKRNIKHTQHRAQEKLRLALPLRKRYTDRRIICTYKSTKQDEIEEIV